MGDKMEGDKRQTHSLTHSSAAMGHQLVAVLLLALEALVVQGGVVPLVRTMPLARDAPVLPAPRIIGGYAASRGQFPHQAALYIDDLMFCGGSLISDSFILTAGHCVSGYSHWIIYLGSLDLSRGESDRQIAQSVDAILHESYNEALLAYDVALLRLRSPVDLSFAVQPVVLDGGEYGDHLSMPAKVSGWGRTSDYSNDISPILYYTELTIISNIECTSYFSGIIQDYSLCAFQSFHMTNPCNGDSGGALMVAWNDIVLQVGVTSFVSNLGCLVGPSGYSRVSFFRDWIKLQSGV